MNSSVHTQVLKALQALDLDSRIRRGLRSSSRSAFILCRYEELNVPIPENYWEGVCCVAAAWADPDHPLEFLARSYPRIRFYPAQDGLVASSTAASDDLPRPTLLPAQEIIDRLNPCAVVLRWIEGLEALKASGGDASRRWLL